MAFTKSLFEQVAPFPVHFIHDDWIAICSSWYGKVAFIDKPLTYEKNGYPLYDYRVKRIADTLNEVVIALERVRNNG